MADQAEERIEAALEALEGVAGPSAAAERARANLLLLQVEALEHQKDADDRSGSGSGQVRVRARRGPSGSGGGGGPSGDDRSGRGGGSGSGSGSGSSGSGSGSSGSSGRRPAMTEPGTATEGRRLGGRYRVEALLATGGMGEVWAARDLLLNRAVAVKVLGGALAGDGRAAERLRREARAAARLEHPSIARVLDLGEQDGRPYLVMELLEGESLAARIDRAGAMAAPEAARVVAAVADALEAAHRAGVVHRDVKPGNVFLTSDGEVKVLDFGIASAAGEAALTTGEMLGTPAYLAPERVLGHPATPAADIYALGVVLYELLAGRRPFDGSDIELAMIHVHAHPAPSPRPPPRRLRSWSPPASRPWPRTHRPAPVSRRLRPARPRRAPRSQPPRHPPAPLPAAVASNVPTPPVAGRRSRSRRRGLLVALLVAGAVLAALPVLGGGLLPWAGEQLETPFVVQVPGGVTPADADPAQGSTRPGAQPSGEPAHPPWRTRRGATTRKPTVATRTAPATTPAAPARPAATRAVAGRAVPAEPRGNARISVDTGRPRANMGATARRGPPPRP